MNKEKKALMLAALCRTAEAIERGDYTRAAALINYTATRGNAPECITWEYKPDGRSVVVLDWDPEIKPAEFGIIGERLEISRITDALPVPPESVKILAGFILAVLGSWIRRLYQEARA